MSKHLGYSTGSKLRLPSANKIRSESKIKTVTKHAIPFLRKKNKPVLEKFSDSAILKLYLPNLPFIGLLGSIIGQQPGPAAKATNSISVTLTNSTEFKNSVTAIQESVVENIMEKIVSANTNFSNITEINLNDVRADNASINIDVDQQLKIVKFVNIDATLVENITSGLSTKLIDDIVNTLDIQQINSLASKSSSTTENSIIDSLLSIVSTTSTKPTSVKNMLESTRSTSYKDTRDTLVKKVLSSSNFNSIAANIVSAAKNNLAMNYKNINVQGDFDFSVTVRQLADIELALKTDLRLLSNIIDQLEKTKEFRFDQNIKTNLENNFKSTATTTTRSEKISGLIDSAMMPIAVAIGGVGVAAAFLMFSSGGQKSLHNLSRVATSVANNRANGGDDVVSAELGGARVKTDAFKSGQFEFC